MCKACTLLCATLILSARRGKSGKVIVMSYEILLPLALILALSKILVKICSRLGLPHVVGMLLAGILIGLVQLFPGQTVLTESALEGLSFIAKIGVILIMFSAGLETDIREIRKIGGPAVAITLAGVIVPMGLGFVVACLCHGGFAGMSRDTALSNLFYGVILTATSVSVTVSTLKELGKLTSKLGSTIVAAAILDDLIGIVVLSFVIGMKGGSAGAQSPVTVLVKTLLFFVAAILFGLLVHRFFRWLDSKYPHHRLIPVLSLALCFFAAYASERWFGVADITGAFVAGLVLSRNPDAKYIDRRSDIVSYMIFTPVFFANIGITSDFSGIVGSMVLFGGLFILAGMIGKVFGCGGAALCCKFSLRDSMRVGVGMMPRAEVALVCAQKGVDSGMISSSILPFIVLLIVITSFLTPILLKSSMQREGAGAPGAATTIDGQVPDTMDAPTTDGQIPDTTGEPETGVGGAGPAGGPN